LQRARKLRSGWRLLNALFGYFVLPESLRPENRKSRVHAVI
jgi:hypothetical protein